MRKEKLIVLMLLCFTAASFLGCKKKYDEKFLGPEYVEASENFALETSDFEVWRINKNSGVEVLQVGNVGLGANYQYYKLKFNERVSWTITVDGMYSGARALIKGVSNEISKANSLWDGASSNDIFFNPDDSITVTIRFAGSDISLSKKYKLNSAKTYNHVDPITGIKHLTLDDFEGGYALTTGISAMYIDQLDINGGNAGNPAYAVHKRQGRYSYQMKGKDVNNNTYLGGCDTPTLNDIPAGTFTTTNPDSLFINMYVQGVGKQNSAIALLIRENDADEPAGVHTWQKNDRWIYFVSVDWVGWKLVSIPYSAFKRPSSNAGLGDNLLTPNKVSGLTMELNSYPMGGSDVEVRIDMIVLTQNGPFKH